MDSDASLHGYIKVSFFFLIAVLYVCVPLFTHAQSVLGTNSISLVSDPQFPAPYSSTTVSLDDYSVNTVGANIFWFVSGVEKPEFKNQRSIEIKTGNLGTKSSVRVVLARENGPRLETTLSLIPAEIDVIIEAQTHIPDFYKGRALPNSKSVVRAVTVVHDGTSAPDSNYTFRWTLNDDVMFGGPVRGHNILDFTMPLFNGGRLVVEVFDTTGRLVGKHALELTNAQPELHFYEWSPLRGLFQKEITSPLSLIGEETKVYGEPYFINTNINNSEADFTWTINGARAPSSDDALNAIVLGRAGNSATAQIGFTVLTKNKIPQQVHDTFQVQF